MADKEVVMDAKPEIKPEIEPKKEAKGEIITQSRLDAEVARRHDAEKKLEALTVKQDEDSKAALVAQNNFKALWEKDAPKAKLADEMAVSIEAYFTEESDGLSDEQKSLIPEGAVHSRLAWLKKAKKAGIFGTLNPTDKSFNGKPRGGVTPDKWYLEIKSDDDRMSTLTTPQYLERKAHLAPVVGGAVRGGF